MMEMKLYDKIFDVANTKMQEHGMEFSFSREVFACFLNKDPNVIHVEEFMDLQSKDFLGAVYLRCLNRLPDSVAYKQLDCFKANQQKQSIYNKYLIIMNVSHSAEFQGMDKKIEGLAELRAEAIKNSPLKIRLRLRVAEYKANIKCVIKKYIAYPIWKRMPNNIKNVIRTVMKREKK